MLKTLLTVVLSTCAALAQAQPDTGFVKTFGNEGEPGSFRARFSRQGGGIVFLQLMDHWRSVAAERSEPHEPGDYMLLVWNGADHALRLLGREATTKFPQDLGTALWDYRELDGGVEFTLDSGNGLRLRRTLRHEPSERGFVLEIGLQNTGAEAGGIIAFQLLGAALANPSHTTLVGNSSIAIAGPVGGDPVHVTPAPGKVQALEGINPHAVSFAGSTSRFFASFLYPRDETASEVLAGLWADTGPAFDDEQSNTSANTVMRMRYDLEFPVPEQGTETVATFGLYLGPKSYRVFEKLSEPERFAPVLDVDLNTGCCFEIPGARQMAYLLLSLLGTFFDFVGNWGVAIIMLTCLVRGLLAPLNFHMQRSMRKYSSKMAVLKPKLDKLKEQHADDPKAYQQAMIAFQREHKIMPPLGGCLPILLTMPVYIGLFTALRTAYDLRQQPFALWIQDLSLSDSLFALPFWPHVFNLLPLLWMGLFLFMAMRQPLPTDPQQRSVQRMMRIMPLVMGVMLYGYASALLLYMVTSMVWSLGESAVVKKILGPVDPNVASMTPTPM